jgi:membrane protein
MRWDRWRDEVVSVAEDLRREWRDDRVGGLAAEVAFFGLLGLFPMLLVLVAALGSLDAVVGQELAARAEENVLDFLRRILTDEAAGALDAVRELFEDGESGVLTVGLLASVWAASRAFQAVVNALDVAYDLEERRSWPRLRLTGLALAVGTAVVGAVILAMLVVGPLFGTGRDIADVVGAGGLFATFWDWLRWPTVVVLVIGWSATVFHLAPNHRTAWRWHVPGAVITAAWWGLASAGFRLYLSVAAGANEVLGTLGGSLIVLLWLYLMSMGLLLGGELNAVLAHRHDVPQRPRRTVRPLRRVAARFRALLP